MAQSNRSETQLSLNELYSLLDRSIKNSQQHIKAKERRLSVLRRQYEGIAIFKHAMSWRTDCIVNITPTAMTLRWYGLVADWN